MTRTFSALLGADDIRHAFLADSRARSNDEAVLFTTLMPYIGDLFLFVDSKVTQRGANPKDLAAIAKCFARHVALGEHGWSRNGDIHRTLLAFARETERLSDRIVLNAGQRGAHFRDHPEICLRGEVAHMYSMGILTFADLLRLQPSAFILKEVPKTN